MLPQPVANLKIQKYYQRNQNLSVYSRNILPEVKHEAFVINLDEYKSIGTRWIVLYVNGDNVTYFDSFGVEYMLQEIKKFIGNKHLQNTSK